MFILKDNPRIELRTVLITGAAKGLGKACTELFLEKGFRVVASDVEYTEVEDHIYRQSS